MQVCCQSFHHRQCVFSLSKDFFPFNLMVSVDDVSFSGSVVPLKTKRRSARSRALLSEDEESPVKEESSSSKKSSRTTSGRKPIADTADLHFPSSKAL